jgi:hypothetical protein
MDTVGKGQAGFPYHVVLKPLDISKAFLTNIINESNG